jgi:hypothetical protein
MTSRVVLDLVEPYANSWRVVAMDNFYSRCSLFHSLYCKEFCAIGSVRKNSKFFPHEQLIEDGVAVDSWRTLRCLNFPPMLAVAHSNKSRTQLYLSTATPVLCSGDIDNFSAHAGKKRKAADPTFSVPSVYLLYNKFMSGVDLANQRAANISMWRKSRRWWMSIVYHYVCVAVSNSWYLYKHFGIDTGPDLTLQEWRTILMSELMGTYCCRSRPGPTVNNDTLHKQDQQLGVRAQRCFVCFHRVGKRGDKPDYHGAYTSFQCRCGKWVCDANKKDCFEFHKLSKIRPCTHQGCKRGH